MIKNRINQYIREVIFNREEVEDLSIYPFNLPIIKNLQSIKLHPRVTFIIGENGSGKSTLLEAIATSYGFNSEGGSKNFTFSTFESHSILHKYIDLVKGVKMPLNGFFLRAESIYNVASNIEELDKEVLGNRIIDSYGGKSLHEQSHGESFFSIMVNRFSSKGLYILDEPEAALSPSRQLAMLTRINELVNQDCQFIICTHSPIIMAYPRSIIYEIKDGFLNPVEYEDTEHYQLTQSFLNNPEKYLDILMS